MLRSLTPDDGERIGREDRARFIVWWLIRLEIAMEMNTTDCISRPTNSVQIVPQTHLILNTSNNFRPPVEVRSSIAMTPLNLAQNHLLHKVTRV